MRSRYVGALIALTAAVPVFAQEPALAQGNRGIVNERAIDKAVGSALGSRLTFPIGTRVTAPIPRRRRATLLRQSLPASAIALREVPVAGNADNHIVRDHGTGTTDNEMIVAPPACGSAVAR